ncbi:trichohyalin-like [Penaeus japonicus]|uniref:trichohyalin-like n=1 Tax=Penaeus japonicus TaxID=27405 RepID=UPI001C7115C9|nr:trichohyalin-like [Penaeus japonicus]
MRSGCACAMVLGVLMIMLGLSWAPTVTPIASASLSPMPTPSTVPATDAHGLRHAHAPPDVASQWSEVALEIGHSRHSFPKRRPLEKSVTSSPRMAGGPMPLESPVGRAICAHATAPRWCKVAVRATRVIRETQGDSIRLRGDEKRRRKRKRKKQKRKRRKKRRKKRKRRKPLTKEQEKRFGNEKTRSRPGSPDSSSTSLVGDGRRVPLLVEGVRAQGDAEPSQPVRRERERGSGSGSSQKERPEESFRSGALPEVPSLLLPLEVLDSRTLARLRYNPSIRVSIQVVAAEQQKDQVRPAENPSENGSEGGQTGPPRWPSEDANRVTEVFTHEERLKNAAHFPTPTRSRPFSTQETEEQEQEDKLKEEQKKEQKKMEKEKGKEEEHQEKKKKEEEEEEETLMEERRKEDPLQKHAPGPSSFSSPSSGTWSNRKRFHWKKKRKKGKPQRKNRGERKGRGRGDKAADKEGERGEGRKEKGDDEDETSATGPRLPAKAPQDGVRVEGADEEELRSTRELVVGLADALEELLKGGLKVAKEHEEDSVEDVCGAWSECHVERALQDLAQLQTLPSCPCVYPADLVYRDAIHDPLHNATFRWLAVSKTRERIDVYYRGADVCIRSLLLPRPRSLAAQTCCYSRDRHLLTRGSGAGSPALVSPEVNPALHRKVDILPWLACRGNFLRYQAVRPPNNGRHCYTKPDDAVYQQQVYMATDY